jgi:hypothetical protein
MIKVSMLEFIRTGEFGSLRLGSTRGEVKALLGDPPDWVADDPKASSRIWRFGDIEFYFSDDTLVMIFTDHDNRSTGTDALVIDPWILREGLMRKEFEEGLTREGIAFASTQWDIDPSQFHVKMDSGVQFSFVDEPEDEFDEPGLVSWHVGEPA